MHSTRSKYDGGEDEGGEVVEVNHSLSQPSGAGGEDKCRTDNHQGNNVLTAESSIGMSTIRVEVRLLMMREKSSTAWHDDVYQRVLCVCVMSLSQPSGAGGEGIESDDRHKYSRGFHH